eukprot:7671-Chlamydomonas_euryale.AAC.5
MQERPPASIGICQHACACLPPTRPAPVIIIAFLELPLSNDAIIPVAFLELCMFAGMHRTQAYLGWVWNSDMIRSFLELMRLCAPTMQHTTWSAKP